MRHQKDNQNTKKNFNPKDAILVFSSFTFICLAIIFALIVYDVLTIQLLLSFDKPLLMIMGIMIATIGMLVFGVILTLYIPSKYMDDINNSYQNYSLLVIFAFMFLAALFEELLFRGIIQNLLFVLTGNQWTAIITATLLFIGFHIQYFKKPIMLLNITVPSLTFGWIYLKQTISLPPFWCIF